MTNEEYVKAALRTESLSDEVRSKFGNPHYVAVIASVVSGSMNWIRTVDYLKKFMFYDRYNAALNKLLSVTPSQGDRVTDDSIIRLIHAAMGMLTETGELLEALISEVTGMVGPEQELDRVNLIEEVGDVFWYQAIAADVLKTSFEEIQERNIAKLKARYPGKFENERAVNRDLKVERQVLEGGGGGAPAEVENG